MIKPSTARDMEVVAYVKQVIADIVEQKFGAVYHTTGHDWTGSEFPSEQQVRDEALRRAGRLAYNYGVQDLKHSIMNMGFNEDWLLEPHETGEKHGPHT